MVSSHRYPSFLDCEASGFGSDSYPLSVAWNNQDGEIFRYLIKPAPDWTHWDKTSEAIHGLSRDRLQRNGWPIEFVVARMWEDLSGSAVYTDAPSFDYFWIKRLCEAVSEPLPCSVEHADDLMVKALLEPGEMKFQAQQRLDMIKDSMRDRRIGTHDAGFDVGWLIQLWNNVQGHTVCLNHNVGPIPDHTKTGTYVRLKKEDFKEVS